MMLSLKTFFKKSNDGIIKLVKLLVLSDVLAIFSAYVFWGQSFTLSWRSSALAFCIFLFFYLIKIDANIDFLKRVILLFGGLYCILWVYAMSRFPDPVFSTTADAEMSENLTRGIYRINFSGETFIIPCFFLALNNVYTKAKKKWLWLLLAAIFYLFIILQVTRQLILWTGVIAVIYIYVKNKRLVVTGLCVLLLAYFLFFASSFKISDESILGSMLAVTENQIDNGSLEGEDTRTLEYKYFFSKYSKNIITDLIGNGMPHDDSSYGKRYLSIKDVEDFYLSDVGYASMFAVQGIFGLIIYLLIFLKSSLAKFPPDKQWLRMYMIFMILANIAASWYFTTDGQLLIAIITYLVYKYRLPKKTIENEK